MNPGGITLGRVAAMVGFTLSCFGLLLFLWLSFGGPIPLKPKGYRFTAAFNEATQLADEADVRISGVSVGKVRTVAATQGRTKATIELESKYAPLPKDSKAILRQKTLLGETYVELTPGTKGKGTIPEDGVLPTTQIADTVELDEIYRTFDPATRGAFRRFLANSAVAVDGRGQDLNDALGSLGPLADDASTLVALLNKQQPAVTGVVRDTGAVLEALTEDERALSGLITNSNEVFELTATRQRELQDIFRILPTFQRETRTTLARTEEFADDTRPLIQQLRPAARELSPTLVDLGALAPDLRGLFQEANPLITASRRGFPALQDVLDELRPTLGQTDPTLRDLNPVLDFLGGYKREITSFFANSAAATQATDRPVGSNKPVHYLRTTNPLNLENLAVYNRRLGSNRTLPYPQPGYADKLDVVQDSLETRHCNRDLPLVSSVTSSVVPAALTELVQQSIGGLLQPVAPTPLTERLQVPNPPCRPQRPFPAEFGGKRFPIVSEIPDSRASAARKRRAAARAAAKPEGAKVIERWARW